MPENDGCAQIIRLREQVTEQWMTPLAVSLHGPGPFQLPLCAHASVLGQGSESAFVLQLVTVKQSQPLWIPILADQIASLKAQLDGLYEQYCTSAGQGR